MNDRSRSARIGWTAESPAPAAEELAADVDMLREQIEELADEVEERRSRSSREAPRLRGRTLLAIAATAGVGLAGGLLARSRRRARARRVLGFDTQVLGVRPRDLAALAVWVLAPPGRVAGASPARPLNPGLREDERAALRAALLATLPFLARRLLERR